MSTMIAPQPRHTRELSPPLETAPALPPPPRSMTPLDRLEMWFLANDAEQGHVHTVKASSPARSSTPAHPSIAEITVADMVRTLRAVAPFVKDAARSAFLPLPAKDAAQDEDDTYRPTRRSDEAVLETIDEEKAQSSILNPYLGGGGRLRMGHGRPRARSPLSMSLPHTANDLDLDLESQTEPPSQHDWLTVYLATLAIFIWAAVILSVVDSGLLADVWREGFNWHVLPNAITDPVRTWAVADDVLGIAGVCNGGVCQWTPLV